MPDQAAAMRHALQVAAWPLTAQEVAAVPSKMPERRLWTMLMALCHAWQVGAEAA